MAAKLFFLPFPTAFNANGLAVPGAKAYFYATGTTTEVPVYSEPTLTTELSNPVQANGSGRFPEIYLDDTILYRVVITDADGGSLGSDVDPYLPGSTVFSNYYLAASGTLEGNFVDSMPALSALTVALGDVAWVVQEGRAGEFVAVSYATWSTEVTADTLNGLYIRSVTDPTIAWKRNYEGNVIVSWWGATGDGTTNDTAAIQAAIDSGEPVEFPPGTYVVSARLTVNTAGQRLIGAGEKATTIEATTGTFDIFKFGTGGTVYEYAAIEGMTIDATGMTGGYAINVDAVDRFIARNIRLEQPWNAIRVHKANVATFDEVYGQKPQGDYAFHLDGEDGERSDVIRILNCNFGGIARTWTGIYAVGPINTVQVIGSTFVEVRRGIHFEENTGGESGQFQWFHDLEIDYADQECIRIEAGYSFKFTNLYAQGSQNTENIYIGADATGIQFTGGMSRGALKEGLVTGGADTQVTNMRIEFNSYPTGSTYDAVRVTATANRTLISNCLLGSTEGAGTQVRYGVNVADGASGTTIVGCNFFGCLLGDVLDNNTTSDPLFSTQVVAPNIDTYPTNTRIQGFEIGCASGRGATFTATVSAGKITAVAVVSGGTDYTVAPSMVAIGPSGTGFAATANLTNGVVTSVTVTNQGSGYTSAVKVAAWPASDTPTIRARWTGQPDIPLRLLADGTGEVRQGNDRGIGFVSAADDLSSVNYLKACGKASATTPELQSQGPGANIDLALTPKGAGVLKLGGPTAATAGAVAGYLSIKIGTTTFKIPYHAV